MNESTATAAVTPKTKKLLKREHLWLMNGYDVIYQLDCSAYPQLKLADLLVLPVQAVINKHGIA
jgi:hypothetical protein